MNFYNTKLIRSWDEYTILNEPINSFDLMERAAKRALDAMLKIIKPSDRILIVCGQGNNGGDGLVIAKLLLDLGYDVVASYFTSHQLFSKDALHHFNRLEKSYPKQLIQSNEIFDKLDLPSFNIVIDALFGSGLNRPLDGAMLNIIETLNTQQNCIKLAVDIPSGYPSEINVDEMKLYEKKFLKCQHTFTFQQLKSSFLYTESDIATGKIEVINIGLSQKYQHETISLEHYLNIDQVKDKLPPRNKFSHKGTFGHGLFIGGSRGKYGALILGAKALMKTGVGMATVVCTKNCEPILPIALPEVMSMVNPGLDFLEFQNIDFSNFDAIGIGPGMGIELQTEKLLLDVLNHSYEKDLPIVLDADALNIVAKIGMEQIKWPKKCIITPHPKEFDRLANKTFIHSKERADYAKYLAQKYQISVLLKGGISGVYLPNGEIYYQLESSASLATAGSGDSLTGVITSLLAQGLTTQDAASIGMYIHAWAGVWCEKNYGIASTTASNISQGISAFYLFAEKNLA
jgi:ADP-dependent NAD(P)H-hydrate dehydratase / NAD(P)H-hydrate epimerase